MRKQILFSGKVQGVGFRYICSMYAISLKLTGFVKNLESGEVEAQVQGPSENISILIEKMQGVKHIRVDRVEEREIPEVTGEEKFTIA